MSQISRTYYPYDAHIHDPAIGERTVTSKRDPSASRDNAKVGDRDIIKNRFSVQQYESAEEDAPLASCRGAGAILFSSLVHEGWHFPLFLLTDSDERYLFDLEVPFCIAFSFFL